ncbi:MAG TPA: isoamylase early set domain-containing protein [Clostridia bacterium]|nr:isoamylase early set domain-containing protein [Clostridia bacterium]
MLKPVNFYCQAPEAKAVSLVGGFNSWNPLATPMKRQLDGSWSARVDLSHGHHQYLFLVDGQPTLDPNACGVARNEINERVSLKSVS